MSEEVRECPKFKKIKKIFEAHKEEDNNSIGSYYSTIRVHRHNSKEVNIAKSITDLANGLGGIVIIEQKDIKNADSISYFNLNGFSCRMSFTIKDMRQKIFPRVLYFIEEFNSYDDCFIVVSVPGKEKQTQLLSIIRTSLFNKDKKLNKEAKELSNKIRNSHISIINDHLRGRPLLEGLSLLSSVTLHFISRCVENNQEKMNSIIELYCQNIKKAHNYKEEKHEDEQEIMERLISSFEEICKNDTCENTLNAAFLFFMENFIKYSDKTVSLEKHAENIKEKFINSINAYKSIETE